MPDVSRQGQRWVDCGIPDAEARVGAILGGVGRFVTPAVSLLASAARTASGAGADVADQTLMDGRALFVVLDVTAQSGTTPTLDVAVQAKVGANYYNLARFSQVGAATATKLLKVNRFLAASTEQTLAADPAVGTGLLVVDNEWLSTLRVKYAIAGTTPSYTFSVVAYPVK